MTAKLLIGLIRVYQFTLSPFLGGSCRFLPTCSAYAIEALATHGAWRGAGLALRRIGRCHPLGVALAALLFGAIMIFSRRDFK